tara:strand:+ start:2678 stop:3526 length:849 start_codon:yes stop_codon:yes gene_type:complete
MTDNTIFVSIATYRDPKAQTTVRNLLKNANHPENITIAVIEQNLPQDRFRVKSAANIKVMRNVEAKGPAWARFLASTLHTNEKWYLQIDSHMNFCPGWDTDIIQQIKPFEHEKCVFTCYPPQNLPIPDTPVKSITQKWSKDKDNHIIARGSIVPATKEPDIGFFVSANFLFFLAQPFLKEIPFDPNLKYIFQGEEILLSARLFTRGWTIYHPGKCVCSHDYGRHDSPKIWQDSPEFSKYNETAVHRYRYLTHQLPDKPEPNLYGEGTTKTMTEWKNKIKLFV